MKFDYIIGNPPYQEDMEATSDKPIYNYFMDEAYEIADKVLLITPGRFLFNAGKTPKPWNKKMLADPHLKVLKFEQSGTKVFENADIKGGIAITYHDNMKNFGAIGTFTSYPELNKIFGEMKDQLNSSFSDLVYAPESYNFTDVLHEEHPEAKGLMSKNHEYNLTTNIFDKLPDIAFFDKRPDDGEDYIRIYGRRNNRRVELWVRRDYIRDHENLDKWKVIVPKSNGSGALGEPLSSPIVGEPAMGHTQSFISIGAFDTEAEAEACLKYIKTKFARTMLSILKATQDNKKRTWAYVPMQDFTVSSDIDWSKSISDIDQQLYAKYGLDEDDISFIESHVKEMS